MSANKRGQAERDRDLADIARLYCQGMRQVDIAEILGITQQQVSYDLKRIQKRWQTECIEAISQGKARELARIDELERTYWSAWFESQRQRKSNPAFLQGVMTCIDKRCKLLGLDAPIKTEDDGNRLVRIIIGDQVEANGDATNRTPDKPKTL
jgi:predicted transcriptional regulator